MNHENLTGTYALAANNEKSFCFLIVDELGVIKILFLLELNFITCLSCELRPVSPGISLNPSSMLSQNEKMRPTCFFVLRKASFITTLIVKISAKAKMEIITRSISLKISESVKLLEYSKSIIIRVSRMISTIVVIMLQPDMFFKFSQEHQQYFDFFMLKQIADLQIQHSNCLFLDFQNYFPIHVLMHF